MNFHSLSFGKFFSLFLWRFTRLYCGVMTEATMYWVGFACDKKYHIDFYLRCPLWCVYKNTQIMCTYSAWETENWNNSCLNQKKRIEMNERNIIELFRFSAVSFSRTSICLYIELLRVFRCLAHPMKLHYTLMLLQQTLKSSKMLVAVIDTEGGCWVFLFKTFSTIFHNHIIL